MSTTLQYIIVAVIVIAAIVLLVKKLSHKDNSCGCGCDGCKRQTNCDLERQKKEKE